MTTLSVACNIGNTGAEATAQASLSAGAGATEKLRIVTTLYPLEYFSARIAGGTADVSNLMAPGVEAHDFEPTAGDIRRLSDADLFIYNGAGFEPWIDRALRSIPDTVKVVEAAHDIAAVYEEGHFHSGPTTTPAEDNEQGPLDPHVWLSPVKAIAQVKLVRDALIEKNPTQAALYSSNAGALMTELEALHFRFQAGLTACANTHVVTSHDAFSYMAREYGFQQVSITGLSPEAEPTPSDVAKIADLVREIGARYILVEPIVSRKLAQTVARETGASLAPLHPLESVTLDESEAGETYFTLMDKNLENLQLALGCQAG